MKPKKSLGQNFLKSAKALSDIVNAGEVSVTDTILEIGPGKGALTEKLLEKGGRVLAIEKDRELIEFLKEKFAKEISEEKLELIEADILEIDPKEILAKKNYKIIANIPYYITGAVIRKFLESDFQPKVMVLLVQKEVAERIVVRDGKESILSISVKAYGVPKYISKVSARYFTPEPKVDSAIISIENITKDNFKSISEKNFFSVVKIAFGQKRKTLIKNLSSVFDRERIGELFLEMSIDEKARPENISIEKYLKIAEGLFPQKIKTK